MLIFVLIGSFNTFADSQEGIDFLKSYQTSEGGWADEDLTGIKGFRVMVACGVTNQTKYNLYDRLRSSQGYNDIWAGSSTLTCYAIMALIENGENKNTQHITRTINTITASQLADGSWGTNIQTTASNCISLALIKGGSDPAVQKAADWLINVQNSDGGWGAFAGYSSSSNCYEFPTIALILAKGKSHSATQKAINWWKNYTPNATNLYYIKAAVLIYGGYKTEAQQCLSSLVSTQNTDGGWKIRNLTQVPSDYDSTHKALFVLGKGRQMGITGLNTSIEKGITWLNNHIKSDGTSFGASVMT